MIYIISDEIFVGRGGGLLCGITRGHSNFIHSSLSTYYGNKRSIMSPVIWMMLRIKILILMLMIIIMMMLMMIILTIIISVII